MKTSISANTPKCSGNNKNYLKIAKLLGSVLTLLAIAEGLDL